MCSLEGSGNLCHSDGARRTGVRLVVCEVTDQLCVLVVVVCLLQARHVWRKAMLGGY